MYLRAVKNHDKCQQTQPLSLNHFETKLEAHSEAPVDRCFADTVPAFFMQRYVL